MLSYIHGLLREGKKSAATLTEIVFIDASFESISKDEMEGFGAYENLEFINFAEVGLKSIQAPFPELNKCLSIMFSNNSLDESVISTLVKLRNLESLALDGNQIGSLEKFHYLAGLRNLREISLVGCPAARSEGYRGKLFAILPQLEIIDDMNKAGESVEYGECTSTDVEDVSEEGTPFNIEDMNSR